MPDEVPAEPLDGIAAMPGLLELSDVPHNVDKSQAVALHVLSGQQHWVADVSRKFMVGDICVTFDNCCHASGHQRAYVRCTRFGTKGCSHPACWHYCVVHRHHDEVSHNKKNIDVRFLETSIDQ